MNVYIVVVDTYEEKGECYPVILNVFTTKKLAEQYINKEINNIIENGEKEYGLSEIKNYGYDSNLITFRMPSLKELPLPELNKIWDFDYRIVEKSVYDSLE